MTAATDGVRSFHARGAAAAKHRSPIVAHFVRGTNRAADLDDPWSPRSLVYRSLWMIIGRCVGQRPSTCGVRGLYCDLVRSDTGRPVPPDGTWYVLEPSASEGPGEVVSLTWSRVDDVLNRPGEQQHRRQPVDGPAGTGQSGKGSTTAYIIGYVCCGSTAVDKPRQSERSVFHFLLCSSILVR